VEIWHYISRNLISSLLTLLTFQKKLNGLNSNIEFAQKSDPRTYLIDSACPLVESGLGGFSRFPSIPLIKSLFLGGIMFRGYIEWICYLLMTLLFLLFTWMLLKSVWILSHSSEFPFSLLIDNSFRGWLKWTSLKNILECALSQRKYSKNGAMKTVITFSIHLMVKLVSWQLNCESLI